MTNPAESGHANCPVCGTVLADADAEGLCVVCLLGEAMGPRSAAGSLGCLGNCELLEIIALGGMGIVYRARNKDTGQEIALKALPGTEMISPGAKQRFRIEAEAMALLDHPHILPIHDLGEEDGTPFFTMKLAAGGSLAERIDTYRGKWREIAGLIAVIAEAAQYAHEHGVLHRDLKPGNVLFDENGEILVSDFGLAKLVGSQNDLTRTVALMGTPNYMAPELTRGGKDAVSTACDVWSLGVMLYELLSGQPPFRGDNLAAVLRQINETVLPSLPHPVPRDLAVIASKGIQKSPAQRYPSARAIADDLHRWLRGDPIHARPMRPWEQFAQWTRRRPDLAFLCTLIVLITSGAAALLWISNRKLATSLAAEKQALAEAESNLVRSYLTEAEALRESQDHDARNRMLGISSELAKLSSGDFSPARSVAISGLLKPGVTPIRKLPAHYVSLSSKAAISPDFRWYATGLADGGKAFAILDLKTGEPVHSFTAPAPGNTFRFSRDGKWIAAKLRDRSVTVHAIGGDNVAPVFRVMQSRGQWWPVFDFLPDATGWVYADGGDRVFRKLAGDSDGQLVFTAPGLLDSLAFSPDGKYLAATWADGWGVIDTTSWTLLWQQDSVSPTAMAPVWTPDGTSIAMAITKPPQLVLRAADSGAIQRTFLGHRGNIATIAIHPGGGHWLTEGWDHQVTLWDAASSLPIFRSEGLPRGSGFSPDGREVVFGRVDGKGLAVHHLDLPSFAKFWQPGHAEGETTNSIDLSHDGRLLLTTTHRHAVVWDVSRRCQSSVVRLAGPNSHPSVWILNPNEIWALHHSDIRGHRIPIPAHDGNSSPPEPIRRSMSLLPPERLPLARAADGQTLLTHTPASGTRLWNSDGSERPRPDSFGELQVRDVSPDETFAASQAFGEDLVRIFRTSPSKILPPGEKEFLSLPNMGYAELRFTPDSRHLVAADSRRTVIVSTRPLAVVTEWPNRIGGDIASAIAISPDGQLLAERSNPGIIHLRHTSDWRKLATLRLPGEDFDYHGRPKLVWTRDSRRLIIVGQALRVLDLDVTALREELGSRGLGW